MREIIGSEYEEPLQEILELYNEGEVDLKAVGRLADELCVAGVNQLRYSGQHLLRALVATDADEIQGDLNAAKRHAERAIYDVNDAAIQHYLVEIQKIRSGHSVNLNAIVPDYGDVVAAIERAEDHIDHNSRIHQNNRGEFYQRAREDVAVLRHAHRILLRSLPDIGKQAHKENRVRLLSWLSIGIVVIGTIVRMLM